MAMLEWVGGVALYAIETLLNKQWLCNNFIHYNYHVQLLYFTVYDPMTSFFH